MGRLWCTAVRRGSVVNSSYGVGALLVGETLETTPCVLHTILFNQQHCAVEHNVVPVVAEVVHVQALSRRLLKFSGGSGDDYATFSASVTSPSC